ncbi:hypothetical protein [Burkholderia gladioli]|uniref:hypothetical protein n=1 Tax=Burkholderia gladioli TaxID=28095 RepID=UPI002FE3E7A6
MSGTTNVEVLRDALAEAENELCSLGDMLVNDGWDTATITYTLDVIRIALYGNDGSGNGPEGFEAAIARVRKLRADEAAASK